LFGAFLFTISGDYYHCFIVEAFAEHGTKRYSYREVNKHQVGAECERELQKILFLW
jgi:hypothetical protein